LGKRRLALNESRFLEKVQDHLKLLLNILHLKKKLSILLGVKNDAAESQRGKKIMTAQLLITKGRGESEKHPAWTQREKGSGSSTD